jgi:HAT1-interacting factor 1
MAETESSPKEPVAAPDAAAAPETSSDAPPEARLEDLRTQATAKYAVKDYQAAADLYSRATELLAEINGEMSPKNANLLYFYGRCLYHLAVSNSDVLGSRVAGEEKEAKKAKKAKAESSKAAAASSKEDPAAGSSSKAQASAGELEDATAPKPFFQFQGDENFDVSDEEEEGPDGDADEAAPGADDDFSDAFEVLDLARVLLQRQLEELKAADPATDPAEIRALEERLADTFDLQAEISLENENFPQAAADMRSALALKRELFPVESSMVAEAHYKLSLALEFSAVTRQADEGGAAPSEQAVFADEKMRAEAATEMKSAIASCEARVAAEEAKAGEAEEAEAKKLRKEAADVKEMVNEMKQRVSALDLGLFIC